MKIIRHILMLLCISIAFVSCIRGKDNNKDDEKKSTKSHVLAEAKNNNLTKVNLLLDWTPNTNHLGAYVARELRFFADESLEVSIDKVGDTSVALVVGNDKAAFGYTSQSAVTRARAADSPISLVAIAAIIQHNTSGFAGLKSSGIQTPKDFEGKKYSSYGIDSEKPTLDDIMSAFGGDVEKVTFVPGGQIDLLQGIQSNFFDIIWIFEGWQAIAAREKNIDLFYIPLVDIDTNFDYYTPVIASSQKYLSENRDTTMRFMRALKKGYEWSVENPEEAAAILYEAEPFLDKNLVLQSALFLASKFIDDADTWGIMKQEPWDNYTRWLQKKELISNSFSVEGAFTNEFVNQE